MLQRNARLNIMNAVALAVAMNLINPYVGIYAIRLGATDLQLGYLSSWPSLVSVIAVLGAAAAVARSQNKQRLIAAIFLLGRSAALGAAAVPFFPEQYRVWALIFFWVLAVFPGHAAGTALQSLLADVFPGSDRTRALASRRSWETGAGMVVVLVSGWLLDNIFPYPTGYQIVFVLSFLVALLEVRFLLGLKEPEVPSQSPVAGPRAPRPAPPSVSLRSFIDVFKHRPFALFVACSIPFHFTWQMAWPIFTRFQVDVLHADNTWLSLITVANSLVAVLTYPLWAKYTERFGGRLMIGVAALWLATAPTLSSMAPSIEWLVAVNFFTGIGVAGITFLILNNLLEVSPSEGRPVYLAVHSALVMVSASIAPMVGAAMMANLPIRMGLQISSGLRLLTAAAFFVLFWRSQKLEGKMAAMSKESAI